MLKIVQGLSRGSASGLGEHSRPELRIRANLAVGGMIKGKKTPVGIQKHWIPSKKNT